MRVLLVLLLVAGTVGVAEAQTDTTVTAMSVNPSMEKTGAEAREGGLQVREMIFCTAIGNRQPAGTDTVFSSTVKKVYCLTRIAGSKDTTSVSHVWYRGDKEMARVRLPVKSVSWRTWSSKRIWEKWTGRWRVDVVSPDGKVIRSKEFLIRSPSE